MKEAKKNDCVVLDACCIINLGAAGDLDDMLSSIPLQMWVPLITYQEALHIRRTDEKDQSILVDHVLDLQPAFDSGCLRKCELDSDEAILFVQFATELDDGEAACLAVAKKRGWILATDDRKARRLAVTAGVTLLSTPELIKLWADNSGATEAAIRSVITNIRTFARFAPRPSSAEAKWWISHN